MKKVSILFAALVLTIICTVALSQQVYASFENGLRFELNESGDGYIVVECSSDISDDVVKWLAGYRYWRKCVLSKNESENCNNPGQCY